MIQPIQQQLHTEVCQKLTATDILVKDNIAKLIRSRVRTQTLHHTQLCLVNFDIDQVAIFFQPIT